MSPEGTVVQGKLPHPSVGRRRAVGALRRPNDMREGVFNAFAIVQEGFDETARSLAVAVATGINGFLIFFFFLCIRRFWALSGGLFCSIITRYDCNSLLKLN